MPRPTRSFAALVLAFTALAGLAACSSTEDVAAPATTSTSTIPAGASDPEDDSGSADGTGASEDEATDCEADQEAGSERLSGSETVMWTADTESTQATTDATADTTLTFQSDGTLDRSELTIGVNEVFAIVGDDEIRAVIVGCADGQTVYGPAPAGFYITAPGTYDVVEELSDATIATITVE